MVVMIAMAMVIAMVMVMVMVMVKLMMVSSHLGRGQHDSTVASRGGGCDLSKTNL
jgi:hypothetical protein